MNKQQLIESIRHLHLYADWEKEISTLLDQYEPHAPQGGWPEEGDEYYFPDFQFLSVVGYAQFEGAKDSCKRHFGFGLGRKTYEEATKLAYRMLTITRKWKPERDQDYWTWDFNVSQPVCCRYDRYDWKENDISLGNCFPTKKDCESHAEKCGWDTKGTP